MKLRLYERFLTALFALAGIVLGVFLCVCMFYPPLVGAADAVANNAKVIVLACLGVWVVLGAYALYVSLKFKRSRHTGFVSVQNSDQGDVLISVSALHSLASKAVANIDGVTCKDVRVVEHSDSVSLRLRMTIKGDYNIPNTTTEMQRAIRTHIETHSGIAVRDVKVIITDIITAPEMIVSKPVASVQNEEPVEEIYYEPEPVVRDTEPTMIETAEIEMDEAEEIQAEVSEDNAEGEEGVTDDGAV